MALDPDPKPIAIGRGELLRDGCDLAIVALGKTVPAALVAAERLAEHDVAAAVVDARFVKPLDVELLADLAARVRAVLTVEDHALAGGFGSAVLEALGDAAPGTRVHRLGIPDRFIEHAEQDSQWRTAGIDADAIVRRALEALAPRATAPRRAVAG